MASRQKSKGKRGESDLSKLLNKYFEGSFIRVPNSGSYIGGSNAFRKENMSVGQIRGTKADIIPPDELPKLVFESKFYKDYPFHHFVYGTSNSILDGWMKDLEHDCDDNDLGFLCIKINYKGWFVGFNKKWLFSFKITNCVFYGDYVFTDAELFFEANKDEIIRIGSFTPDEVTSSSSQTT